MLLLCKVQKMKHLEYLNSILPKNNTFQCLREILSSNNVQVGVPYEESISLLSFKYKHRRKLNENSEHYMLGIDNLIEKLSHYSIKDKANVYPLKNDALSGDCIIINNKIVGYSFIRRGQSFSKKGLWINGRKFD